MFSKKQWVYHVCYQLVRNGGLVIGSTTATISHPLDSARVLEEFQESLKQDTKAESVVIINWIELKG